VENPNLNRASRTATKHCIGCQAELDIHTPQCPYCQARQLSAFEIRLWRAVRGILPRQSPATKVLFAFIVLHFIIISVDIIMHPEFGISNALFAPPIQSLQRWGAHVRGDLIWWRLITANFVHIGLIHICFNGFALRYVMPYVERSFGSALTFSAFVTLGTGSMLCSNLLGSVGITVAGASGGLMALIGMAAAAAHRENTGLSKQVRNSMITWAAVTMVFGFLLTNYGGMGVDNIAHFSGFVLGWGAGFVLPKQSATGFTRRWMYRFAMIALIATTSLTIAAFLRMAAASESGKYQTECIRNIKAKAFKKAQDTCGQAYEADKTQTISYHNFILINAINGHVDKARQLCLEAERRFAARRRLENAPLSFDALCTELNAEPTRKSVPDEFQVSSPLDYQKAWENVKHSQERN